MKLVRSFAFLTILMVGGCTTNYEKTPVYCAIHNPDRCVVINNDDYHIYEKSDSSGFEVKGPYGWNWIFHYEGKYTCGFDRESMGITPTTRCVVLKDHDSIK